MNLRPFGSPIPSQQWLLEGTTVLVNNEIGIVKFIGEVDFASGTWLGIDLRAAKGKNDGTVHRRRYFHCKPMHGIMVRPSKVSVRGINGAKQRIYDIVSDSSFQIKPAAALQKFLDACTDEEKSEETFPEDKKIKTYVSQIKSQHAKTNLSVQSVTI
ncbi:CAP-Gly domain-containing linker protein 4 [Nymphon striatum]|nr:CAP-Gly domain-containing linker protein 4 [Nymphon striatum]